MALALACGDVDLGLAPGEEFPTPQPETPVFLAVLWPSGEATAGTVIFRNTGGAWTEER